MEITSAQYIESPITNANHAIQATIDGQQWVVPMQAGNTHYDEIMRQVNAGTLTIQDAD